MREKQKVIAIIMAGGTGKRAELRVPKQYAIISGKSMISMAAAAFVGIADVFVVTAPQGEIDKTKTILNEEIINEETSEGCLKAECLHVTAGGLTRTESVHNALEFISQNEIAEACDIVLIHDAARPFVSPDVIDGVIDSVISSGSGIPAVPVKDTIYRVSCEDGSVSVPKRDELFAVQTPQGFTFSDIFSAHEQARKNGEDFFDDGSVYLAYGLDVKLTTGDYSNSKITTKHDILAANGRGEISAPDGFRIGSGFDVHRLVPERKLILGGVEVDHELGLAGHSDADVVIHALMDAIFGAQKLGDIGEHFPDTDSSYEGISSMVLLERTVAMMQEDGWAIVNADITILAERPKLAPYRSLIETRIAETLGVSEELISVKATTTEGLGFAGREEGIGAQAIVLLRKDTTAA